jgi:hypothetical protein
MAEYSGEKWVEIYTLALTELRHAKMRGRIGDARTELVARVEKLKNVPGLHEREYQAIDDAFNALRYLEREENRFEEKERRETLEVATQKLQSIAPRIKRLGDSASE